MGLELVEDFVFICDVCGSKPIGDLCKMCSHNRALVTGLQSLLRRERMIVDALVGLRVLDQGGDDY